MSATSRRPGGGGQVPELVALWIAVATTLVTVGSAALAVRVGNWIAGRDVAVPANPFELAFELIGGSVAWPAQATLVIAALVLVALACAHVFVRARRGRVRVDRAAKRMARGEDLHALSYKGAAATAARLGAGDTIGLPIARTLHGRSEVLYQSWEDVSVDIWGPRTGKTTSRAIPAILEAPGAVLATSNKRDIVDATRGPRAAAGDVWVFDPQAIVDERPDWWWNPLTYVTDEVKAQIFADVFTAAGRQNMANSQSDAYFDNAAKSLLANLLLAAALADRPITQVYLWLSEPTDDEAVLILREHGFHMSAAAVAGVVHAPEKQRGGVYGTAQETASFLTNQAAVRWVTPTGPGDGRRQLRPADFVRSSDTLFSLSKEGRGSAGPLVTALTVAVTEAAEDLAKASAGGRLPVPMVAVLDEAANVCRWPELPNLYSHYGSRGICMMTILQSWSQGVEVWGREGMRKLWSAANIRVYGGGVAEAEFLQELSQLIGDYDLRSVNTSYGRGGLSNSYSTRADKILEVADLTSLPKGRAVLFASGTRATLVRTLPWMSGRYADAVRASLRANDPNAEATISESSDAVAGLEGKPQTAALPR
jgi:type IV secretory pathway TraG/TraD family ATPase VirD4